MKLSALILVFIFSMTFSFAKSPQFFGKILIDDESPYAYSIEEYQAIHDLSHYPAETIWPWKRRKSCHGGRKQKRRNKKRLKRARA